MASSSSIPSDLQAPAPPPRGPRGRYSVVRPRLHRGHFAFLRAVAQGLSPHTMWARYLADAGAFDGGPRVHRMTAWIRGELGAAAARGGDFARARLLRLDLAPPGAAPLPSLADFARAEGLDGFREAEQMSAYEAAFGPALARQRRRTALLHRQLDAIYALEAQVAQPVSPADGCEAWLVDAVATRLRRAHLTTLGDLVAFLRAQGPGWWRLLRGIGARKAHAITAFLRAHGDTLGAVPVPEVHVAETPVMTTEAACSPCSACVPLERFTPPSALDGRTGAYRCPRAQCRLTADNDRDAILAWLASKGDGAVGAEGAVNATQRAYRKEAERFLLWVVLVRRCALSSATIEDAVAYRGFLLAPPADWCSVRTQPRWSARWRPLAGPLSPASCAYALGVLGNLYAFLVDQGYLSGNPWRAVRAPRTLTPGLDPGRSLSAEQWAFVLAELEALPQTSANQRLQLALPLLYETGLRLSELIAATTDDLRCERQGDGGAADAWWLSVVGKGGRLREVPVPPDRIAQLGAYLRARGLEDDPRQASGVALLGAATDRAERAPWARPQTIDPAAPIAPSTFHRQIKTFFQRCAARIVAADAPAAARLLCASTHWMRHTHVSHALAGGVPIEVVQQNVGHASLGTTSRYVRTEAARRQGAMARWWRSSQS
ncbi:phage integrase family protein [Cupriavidus pauculus]|uniref:phage integrase family protein n=1 Tax=Cupriavidus pauculus TaxID=82633 RepID=UPI001244E5B3|nr:phage integrase family protein [Cupriavidus pauculus]KAB0601030.1 tyrosine-type recombinase/integrase [Cupriavidus pauculus]UAL01960.1 tyrosine-type recombinase/integrase [Cupriavidus pauculus]